MSNTIVAKRYATALFELAKEKNLLESMVEEARSVKEVFSSNKELITFLSHPTVAVEQKKQLLTNAFASISTEIVNTLMLMVERHRISEIAQMASDFIELSNEEKSVAEALVYTTRPLTEAEREEVSSVFAVKVGKNL